MQIFASVFVEIPIKLLWFEGQDSLAVMGSGYGLAVRQQAITWFNVDQDLLPYGLIRPQWVK